MAKKDLIHYHNKIFKGPKARGPRAAMRNHAIIEEGHSSERIEMGTEMNDPRKAQYVKRMIQRNAGKSVGRAISKGIMKSGKVTGAIKGLKRSGAVKSGAKGVAGAALTAGLLAWDVKKATAKPKSSKGAKLKSAHRRKK